MDYLKTIETFTVVVAQRSFTAAAEQLGMSRALMTRHIMDLEARLGVRLLNRTTRSIVPTEIGSTFYEASKQLLIDLGVAEEQARRTHHLPEGSLTVVAPKSFGGAHFSKAVAEFGRLHPQLSISLILDDEATRSLQINQNDFDVAIRLAPLQAKSSAVVRQIGTLEWIPCAAPSYIQANSELRTPADLTAHNCLIHTSLAADRLWRFSGQRKGIKIAGSFQSNSVLAIRQAALGGVGIALLPTYYISRDLERGRLVRLLPRHPIPERPVFALLPASRMMPSKTRLFIKYIARWYKQRPWERKANGGD